MHKTMTAFKCYFFKGGKKKKKKKTLYDSNL